MFSETESVVDRVKSRFDQLSRTQRRIAEFFVENFGQVAMSTVDKLASQLNVSPSTIVRMAYRLGFNGFHDLQEHVRVFVRSRMVTEEGEAAERSGNWLRDSLQQDLHNLNRTVALLAESQVERAVHLIAAAENIYLTANLSTAGIARYMGLILQRCSGPTHLIRGVDPEALLNVRSTDVLVALSFPPYASDTQKVVRWLRQRHADLPIIAITDGPLAPLARIADVVLPCAVKRTGLQNSMVGAIAVINVITAGLMEVTEQKVSERYALLETMWQEWDAMILAPRESD